MAPYKNKFLLIGAAIIMLFQKASIAPVYGEALNLAPTEGTILTLDEFIKLASQYDTNFDEILINELTLKYQKDLRLPPGDLVASVKEEYNYFGAQDRGEVSSNFGLSKLFPFTGTEVEAAYNITPSANSSLSSSDFSVSLAQPIAENAFGRSTQYLDKIVGLEVEVARYQITEAYEDYLAVLIRAYLNWYQDFENYKIGESSYRENLKLLENIKERQNHQIALPIDVNKIKLQVTAKKEDLIALDDRYQNSLNIINKSIRNTIKGTLAPTTPTLPIEPHDTFENEYKTFKQDSRTYRTLRLLEEKSQLQVSQNANKVLPSINLLLGYEREGNDIGLEQNSDWLTAGVSLEWPIRDQVARAELEISKIAKEKTKLSTENTDAKLHTDIKNLYLKIQREEKLIQIAKEKLQLAEAVLNDETQNYIFGKVTLNDFIQSVNLVDSNRFNIINHELLSKGFILELARLTDRLITKSEINSRHP